MHYKISPLPKSEIEILVTIPFSEFAPQLKKAAGFLSEKNEIEGFRRGKAPYEIIKNRFGELLIYEQAAEFLIRQNYTELLKKVSIDSKRKDFTPIGRPEITIMKLAPGNDLEFKIKMVLLPEVTLPDYKSIAQKVLAQKKEISVSEEEIQKTLTWIRESYAPLITVNRAAQKGDLVEIDFAIKQGGVKMEGEDSKNHPLTIGQNKFLPGFEEQLAGMKSGEEKTFTLVVPEDWHDKTLAGKTLEFRVLLKLVQEKKISELSDEFVKSVGKFSSVEDLRKKIREDLTQEKTEKEKQHVRALLIEEISSPAKIEIPGVLLNSELEKMSQELKSGISNMQMKWEDYLLNIKKTEEDLKKGWRSEAEKRVGAALVLREIAWQEKIEPSVEEVETATQQYLAQFETPEEAREKVDPEELKEYTKGILKNEKVFEFLENL